MFELERYLLVVKNREIRNNLCKFRISAHSLFVERGRYCRPKLNIDQRTCKQCKNKVDNEFHMVHECSLYNNNERKQLFSQINSVFNQFEYLNDKTQFIIYP